MPTGEEARDLILAACDDTYFQKFATPLLMSMDAMPERHHVHLHLLRPSEATVEKAEALRSSFANVRVSYTVDPCQGLHRDNSLGIYYTAARFVLAPLLLDRGIRRLLIIDVDSVMRKSPWPIIDRMPAHTAAGFIFRHEKRRAWQKILAGAVMLTERSESRMLARRFAKSLLVNLARRQQYHLDQIIPHYLIERSNTEARSRIQSLPPEVLSLDYAENAALWTAKGISKHGEQFAIAQGTQGG